MVILSTHSVPSFHKISLTDWFYVITGILQVITYHFLFAMERSQGYPSFGHPVASLCLWKTDARTPTPENPLFCKGEHFLSLWNNYYLLANKNRGKQGVEEMKTDLYGRIQQECTSDHQCSACKDLRILILINSYIKALVANKVNIPGTRWMSEPKVAFSQV